MEFAPSDTIVKSSVEVAADLEFMVVGTGRNGSGFIAHVFNLLGIPCGHEYVFNASLRCRPTNVVGDSNHQSAPHLKYLEKKGKLPIILHQVRNPIAYVKSLCGEIWLPNPSSNEEYMLSYVDVDREDRIKAAMQMWIGWNDLIVPHSTLEYRLETLDRSLLRAILSLLGRERSDKDILRALSGASRNTHVKPREVSDAEIHQNSFFPVLQERAKDYGYEI